MPRRDGASQSPLSGIQVRTVCPNDRPEWVRMRRALWQRHDPLELEAILVDAADQPVCIAVLRRFDARTLP